MKRINFLTLSILNCFCRLHSVCHVIVFVLGSMVSVSVIHGIYCTTPSVILIAFAFIFVFLLDLRVYFTSAVCLVGRHYGIHNFDCIVCI